MFDFVDLKFAQNEAPETARCRGGLEPREIYNFGHQNYQNRAGMVGEIIVSLSRVFSTMLEPPKAQSISSTTLQYVGPFFVSVLFDIALPAEDWPKNLGQLIWCPWKTTSELM